VNTKLATATLIIGAMLLSATGHAAENAQKDKPSMTENAKETLSDAMITTRINAAFLKDKTVSTVDIIVHTDDKGVVTLSGNAKSKAEATKAVKIARATKGVTRVKNEIKLPAK